MNRTRLVYAIALALLLAVNCYSTEWAFMGFDEVEQKMFSVVRGDQGLPHVYVYLLQSNSGGWIGDYDSYGGGTPEVICEAPLSPDDPNRLTDVPPGEYNVITALAYIYDENWNLVGTLERTDSLLAQGEGVDAEYVYVQENCDWVLPDTIRINTAFCATICHGSRSIPIYCEDPNYNPDLLEITVTNGCVFGSEPGAFCDDPNCEPVDWSLFSWRKRVFPDCRLFLSITYCGEGPGCVCIWRSDFILPVDMNSFTAIPGDGQVTVNWNTASESDLTEFRVSRSTNPDDGYTFVGMLPATNSATGHSYTWVDDYVQNGVTYYYKLHIVDANGAHVYNDGSQAIVASATPQAGLLSEYRLDQNYPNPFNSETSFSFSIATADHVTLKVYDLLGRVVAEVLDKTMTSGHHTVNWSVNGLATGVYIYTLTSGGFSDTKKLLFLK